MLNRHCVTLLSAAAFFTLFGLHSAHAQYTFTQIDGFSSSANAAINSSGTVAFAYGNIYADDGSTRTLIASGNAGSPYSNFADDTLGINSSGTVSFYAGLKTGGSGIFSSNGITTTTIATTVGSGFSSVGLGAVINNSGAVAFRASSGASAGVYAGSGGALTTVADNSGAHGAFAGNFSNPSINNQGDIAFLASATNNANTGYYKYSNGSITPIVTYQTSAPNTNFSFFQGPAALNDQGTIAFEGQGSFYNPSTNSYLSEGLFTSDGTNLTTIARRTGPITSFGASLSINNKGLVLFTENFSGGGNGLFTGTGGAALKVAQTGDMLLGKTITNVFALSTDALNDNGSVAFGAYFSDNTYGVFRANATVPEPGSVALLVGMGVTSAGFLLRRRHSMSKLRL